MKPIDKKYLAGLVYRGAKTKVVEKDGRKVQTSEPFSRPIEPEDVLSWADAGEAVVLVTADGQKVTVPKKADKAEGKG